MRIAYVRIKNYRSIKDSGDIYPTKLFAMIGKNNSGKSAFVKAIQALWGHPEVKIEKDDFHKNTNKDIEISIVLTDIIEKRDETKKSVDEKIEIKFTCGKELKAKYLVNNENIAAKEIKKILPELLVIPAIRNPQNESTAGSKSFLKELISLILKEQMKTEGNMAEGTEALEKKQLCDATDDEIEKYLEARRKQQIGKLSSNVNEHFQSILVNDKMKIEISPEGDLSKFFVAYSTKVINSEINEQIENGINLLSCGTGLQSMFILSLLQTYADMTKNSDSILLIEEPEVYLHPEYQRKMFKALRSIASDNQVIYTTHSPIMIGELWADDSVRLVTLDNGETKIKKINIEAVISELGIRYEDVLNPHFIVFVEGIKDEAFYKNIVIRLQPELKDSLDRLIRFIPSDGYRNIDSFAFMQIINSQNVNVDFYILADGDGVEPEIRKTSLISEITKKVKNIKKDVNLAERIMVLSEYSIESYLLNADMLKKAFPNLDKKKIADMLKLYRKKYKDNCQKKWKTTNDHREFQKYFTPKNFFENTTKNEHKYKKFAEVFDKNKEFLEARDSLVHECIKISKKGESVIDYILSKCEKIHEYFKEPIEIIRSILDKVEKKET